MRLRQRVFTRGSWAESSRAAEILRKETVGGVLLVVAAVTALLWANSPWSSWYYRLGAITVGPERLHLNLTLAGWATDGLLAIFFFVVGVELKREFVAGDLRDPGRAALPIVAAVGVGAHFGGNASAGCGRFGRLLGGSAGPERSQQCKWKKARKNSEKAHKYEKGRPNFGRPS